VDYAHDLPLGLRAKGTLGLRAKGTLRLRPKGTLGLRPKGTLGLRPKGTHWIGVAAGSGLKRFQHGFHIFHWDIGHHAV
jgi:hypothetical protein